MAKSVIQITSLLWILSCFVQILQHSSLSSLVMWAINLQVVHSRVVYVTPNATTPCPKSSANSSCHTLNWYSHNVSERLMSNNTVVIFLEGIHSLNSIIYIENCKNLSITGEAAYTLSLTDDDFADPHQIQHPVSWISCSTSNLGIVFLNTSNIHIMNLGFDSCGSSAVLNSGTDNLVIDVSLLFVLSYNVDIIRSIVNNTYGYGVHMNCVFGNIQINDSFLLRASKTRDGRPGGNARFLFGQSSMCVHQCSEKHTKLKIYRSSFIQGLDSGVGIEIIIDCPQVYVFMNKVNAVNNTGGNIALSLTYSLGTTSKISITNSIINGGSASTGGGIRFWSQCNRLERNHTYTYDNCRNCIHTPLTVVNTTFSFNSAQKHGGAVYISHYPSTEQKVVFINCTFINNFGNGAAIKSTKQLTFADHLSSILQMSLEHCHFHGNSGSNNKSGSIISLIMTYTIISNCNFTDNDGSVLTLWKSNLDFHGNIWFVNNHADYGAALKVCEMSLVFLNNNTYIRYANNLATFKGGAVYASQPCVDTTPPCLFQPKLHKDAPITKTLKLEFINNSASIAGDAIYNGFLDSCFTIANYSYNGVRDTIAMLPSYFDMSGQVGPSWVSSDLKGVCFCNVNEPLLHNHCRTKHPVVKVHPGEMFNVSMITVGQMNGSTPGSIKVMFNDDDDFDRLIVHKDRNASSSKCENMTFILQSRQKYATIHFDAAVAVGDKVVLPSSSLDLKVLLKPCPPGFILKELDGGYSCVCDPILCARYGCPSNLMCDIHKKEIMFDRTVYMWFGCLRNSSSIPCELAKGHGCFYCKTGQIAVNVLHLDNQCLPGRTGVMCGACNPGFSYIIETHGIYRECRKCSNRNLFFLVPLFLLSGIALVVFLTVFNVTVTQGTLNGLIFYSNVAYGYPTVFYTGENRFPWVFIAWLNLDLGFEICAYNGMTGYQYIWLSCGYVVYLLCIQIFIIYLSHKFIYFTRLVGKHVMNVLATILLLCYSPIVRIVYYSTYRWPIFFSISNITSKPKSKYVLQFDGTITYFELKHILLFILALVCFIAILFFILSLLLVQCLQKQSSLWCFRWVEKLRPFYEVFTGPCRDNYRFWPGFLLLMRVALFCQIIGIGHGSKVEVATACFVIMSLCGILPRGVYKKWKITALELLFHLNLSVTFAVAEYNSVSKDKLNDNQVAYLSAGIALFLFVGILIYHVYNRIKGTFGWKMLISVCTKMLQVIKLRRSRHNSESDEERAPLLPQPLPRVIRLPEFYEPLLEN